MRLKDHNRNRGPNRVQRQDPSTKRRVPRHLYNTRSHIRSRRGHPSMSNTRSIKSTRSITTNTQSEKRAAIPRPVQCNLPLELQISAAKERPAMHP